MSEDIELDYNDLKDKNTDSIDLDITEPKNKKNDDDEEYQNPLVKKASFFLNRFHKKELDILNTNQKIRSITIDFAKIESFDPKFADELLTNPDNIIEAFKIVARSHKTSLLQNQIELDPVIRIYNLPPEYDVKIKYLNSDNIGKLISVEGIVRQFNTVLPKIKIAHWICKKCGTETKLPQDDIEIRMPRACPECKHKDFELDETGSIFVDYQKIEIQEPLDELKGGEPSNTLDIFVYDDAVNSFTAGDRIIFTGILRLRKPDKKLTIYGKYLECLHIEDTKQEYEDVEISKEDEIKISELSKRDNIHNLIANSVAPNIHGHQKVKEAISMQLFGGVKKILKDKSRIRGNIHILLVGDPGVGKSQMLQYTTRVAPKSLYVVGRGTSGAGLTASAVKDEFSEGGWTLKAGALVLASGGFAMVDEFDKMSNEDRSSMHEAMEQETVSIAKAGIVSTFKTETSILAAANPKYGRFNTTKNLAEQIEIPPTLMSRFDLFFVLKDILDEKRDRETVMSILRTHRDGEKIRNDELVEHDEHVEIRPEIDAEFLRKYISYARTRIFPVMKDDAMSLLQKFFIDLRKKSEDGRVTVTYRQLEALIRLSEASARVRLSQEVNEEDSKRAIALFKASMEQVGIDPETGQMDADILMTGQSHSQTNRIKKITDIIEQLTKDKKTASFNEIVEEAEKEKIDGKKVKEIIEKLLRAGDIYEPRPFNYSITHDKQQ